MARITIEEYNKKIDNYIQQLELELIEFVTSNMEAKLNMLPLTDPKHIRNLLYNLLTSDKWRKILSGKDYANIIDKLLERLITK